MTGASFCGSAPPRIQLPSGLLVNLPRPVAGSRLQRSLSVIATGSMARYSSGAFARWAFEIDRPQNGCAERLIGSIRRECISHIVVVGERHLRHVLESYM